MTPAPTLDNAAEAEPATEDAEARADDGAAALASAKLESTDEAESKTLEAEAETLT